MQSFEESIDYIKISKTYLSDLVLYGMVIMVCNIYNIEQSEVMRLAGIKEFVY